MKVIITPSFLGGEIKAIASKSVAHRQLICAAFSDSETKIRCPEVSEDINATKTCLVSLGAEIEYKEDTFYIKPIDEIRKNPQLNCRESGSTLRFILPVLCALGIECEIKMSGRLPQRPLSPLWEELILNGAILNKPSEDTISVGGKLKGGRFKIRGDVSSQFITGLLFASTLMKEEAIIEITSEIESLPYINITCDVLKSFGVSVEFKDNTFFVSGKLKSEEFYKEDGDWSNGAFFICANELSEKEIKTNGLSYSSSQGDKEILSAIEELKKEKSVIDAKNIPDLVPIISVLASVSPGTTRIINAKRLKIKESDRLKTANELINNLGGISEITEDGLFIKGIKKLKGGTVDSNNDHRIAMSAAVASIVCENEVVIIGAEAVKKSYPDFWEDFKKLGGIAEIF